VDSALVLRGENDMSAEKSHPFDARTVGVNLDFRAKRSSFLRSDRPAEKNVFVGRSIEIGEGGCIVRSADAPNAGPG
jgi:hypothetical protein